MTWVRDHWRLVAYLAAGATLFALGYAAHRPAPRIEYRDRVQVQTKVVEHQVEHIVYREAKQATSQRATHRVEITRPDGTRVVTVDTASAAHVDLQLGQTVTADVSRVSTETATRETSLVQAPAEPRWRVQALVGAEIGGGFALRPVYGAAVSRRLLGPFWVGAWGITAPAGGLSIGAEW